MAMNDPSLPPLRASWINHLRGRLCHSLGRIRKEQVPPNPIEAREADAILRSTLRPAVFGELGGVRPDPSNRHTSWWGGCALGLPDQEIPTGRSGKPMHPLLQVRTDELETTISGLENEALLTLWLDLEGNLFEAVEGIDFAVFTASSVEGLVPIGLGYRETENIPTFPVKWRSPVYQQPSWEDFASSVPNRVAWTDTSDWFYENPISKSVYDLQSVCPVKIGGWPTWIQGSQWKSAADKEDFILQIDANEKGSMAIGDSGSLYLFRAKQSGEWCLCCDFY
jgi:hypothetical protein